VGIGYVTALELAKAGAQVVMVCRNYLGHYLLTMLLLDELKTTVAARIVNVSSLAHMGATIHFDAYLFGHESLWTVKIGAASFYL